MRPRSSQQKGHVQPFGGLETQSKVLGLAGMEQRRVPPVQDQARLRARCLWTGWLETEDRETGSQVELASFSLHIRGASLPFAFPFSFFVRGWFILSRTYLEQHRILDFFGGEGSL